MGMRTLSCKNCGFAKQVPVDIPPLPGSQVRMWFCPGCTPKNDKGAPQVSREHILTDIFGLI